MKRFDAVVLGLGAMGSAIAYQLAKRRSTVLGLDRYTPPHAQGSSHGDTRITRLAIGEGSHYTPLALRSHELWRGIERETGTSLMTSTGGLIISSTAKTSFTHVEGFFQNTVAAAQKFGIAHELLEASEIRRRYPQFKVSDDEVGYLEKDAGFLRPEACIRTQLALAQQHGAEIHANEQVVGFDSPGDALTVTTDRATYTAGRLILAAGPWLPELLASQLAPYFRVYRQVLLWFGIDSDARSFLPERFPVFIWELKGRPQGVYGFPAVDGNRGGVKVATESYGSTTTPAGVDRNVAAEEIAAVYRDYVAPCLHGVSAQCLRAMTCLYTVTPDFGFIIDAHPASERVLVVSACSGHGFKHSAAIGEAVAQLALDGESRLDLSAFKLDRFGVVAPA